VTNNDREWTSKDDREWTFLAFFGQVRLASDPAAVRKEIRKEHKKTKQQGAPFCADPTSANHVFFRTKEKRLPLSAFQHYN
jgi:hypothetical protein